MKPPSPLRAGQCLIRTCDPVFFLHSFKFCPAFYSQLPWKHFLYVHLLRRPNWAKQALPKVKELLLTPHTLLVLYITIFYVALFKPFFCPKNNLYYFFYSYFLTGVIYLLYKRTYIGKIPIQFVHLRNFNYYSSPNKTFCSKETNINKINKNFLCIILHSMSWFFSRFHRLVRWFDPIYKNRAHAF